MKVAFVVPPFARRRFHGGIWCVMQHAQQLAERGHAVTVVPTHPSPPPDWLPRPWGFTLERVAPSTAAGAGLRSFAAGCVAALRFKASRRPLPTPDAERRIRDGLGDLALAIGNHGRHGQRMGSAVDHLARHLPDADVTLATDSETAWPVCLTGRGALAYFAQHYEPYFWKERLGGEASRRESEQSYRLGLHQLANSTWLQRQLEAVTGQAVLLCPNAIDLATFTGSPVERRPGETLRVISYGGRGAEWKGFAEMCEAIRIVRGRRPRMALEWRVYGDALLPPDNSIANYEALGFLDPPTLAAAYRAHHVLLSASWYESFPLFPIEAMACGLAAITTQPGTEDFAVGDDTAVVVPPRDPEALATALLRLADDDALRMRIAAAGHARARQFTWAHAADAMEAALLEVVHKRRP